MSIYIYVCSSITQPMFNPMYIQTCSMCLRIITVLQIEKKKTY